MKVIFEVSNYKITCTKCKSLLEFELADIYYRAQDHYTGYIKCPVCGCAMKVLSEEDGSSFLSDNVKVYYCDNKVNTDG